VYTLAGAVDSAGLQWWVVVSVWRQTVAVMMMMRTVHWPIAFRRHCTSHISHFIPQASPAIWRYVYLLSHLEAHVLFEIELDTSAQKMYWPKGHRKW